MSDYTTNSSDGRTSEIHWSSRENKQEKQPYRCSNEGITGGRSQYDLQNKLSLFLIEEKSWKGSILLYAEILMGINTCTVRTACKSAKVDTLQFNGSMYMCSLHRNAHSLSCSIPKEMHLPVPPMQWNYKAGHQRSSNLKVCNARWSHSDGKEEPAASKGLQSEFQMMKNNQLQGQKGKIDAKIHQYKVFQGLIVSNLTEKVIE